MKNTSAIESSCTWTLGPPRCSWPRLVPPLLLPNAALVSGWHPLVALLPTTHLAIVGAETSHTPVGEAIVSTLASALRGGGREAVRPLQSCCDSLKQFRSLKPGGVLPLELRES